MCIPKKKILARECLVDSAEKKRVGNHPSTVNDTQPHDHPVTEKRIVIGLFHSMVKNI